VNIAGQVLENPGILSVWKVATMSVVDHMCTVVSTFTCIKDHSHHSCLISSHLILSHLIWTKLDRGRQVPDGL